MLCLLGIFNSLRLDFHVIVSTGVGWGGGGGGWSKWGWGWECQKTCDEHLYWDTQNKLSEDPKFPKLIFGSFIALEQS